MSSLHLRTMSNVWCLKDNGENPIVDSLAVVGEWSIVAKWEKFCTRSAEMFRIADVEDHQVLSSGALCTGWFTSGTWKVQRKASRRTPRRTKSSRRRWYLKLAEKYFSRKTRKTFVKSIKNMRNNISSLCFFSGDDAVQLEVERHRQLLHESRLSQGDLSIQLYPRPLNRLSSFLRTFLFIFQLTSVFGMGNQICY